MRGCIARHQNMPVIGGRQAVTNRLGVGSVLLPLHEWLYVSWSDQPFGAPLRSAAFSAAVIGQSFERSQLRVQQLELAIRISRRRKPLRR